MCSRYSSSVVAPTARSSPRASAGLSMLLASTAPFGGARAHERVQLVDEHDEPPLGLLDLTEHGLEPVLELAAVLRARRPSRRGRARRRPCPRAWTARRRRRCAAARPSTMAVLPTPGSPMSTGLFFVRRDRTWMTRRISSSRPITGSSLPSRAACVRLRPNRSSAWNCASGFWSVTRVPPRSSSSARRRVGGGHARAREGRAGVARVAGRPDEEMLARNVQRPCACRPL